MRVSAKVHWNMIKIWGSPKIGVPQNGKEESNYRDEPLLRIYGGKHFFFVSSWKEVLGVTFRT